MGRALSAFSFSLAAFINALNLSSAMTMLVRLFKIFASQIVSDLVQHFCMLKITIGSRHRIERLIQFLVGPFTDVMAVRFRENVVSAQASIQRAHFKLKRDGPTINAWRGNNDRAGVAWEIRIEKQILHGQAEGSTDFGDGASGPAMQQY